MSTTRIQLKRADSMVSLNAVTLAKGEPAVYFDSSSGSGVLYIGDGVTSPGLEFATSGSSVTQHLIANTTTIGPAHTIVATHLGSVITAIDTDDAKMQRLGFYDLGAAQPLSSGLNALGISDILHSGADNTGIRSRWHWMNTTHVGNKRSIFYTEADYTGVGNGSGSGVGNMEHSSVTNADTEIGYQLKSLSYDITSLVDTTGGIMALVAKKNGANNVLEFKRLGSEDLTGDLSTHAITSVSHTGTASSIYHTAAASTSITALSYAAAANGSVLKKSSTGILHFAKLAFTDVTGVFRISGDGLSNEGFTMRYDATGANGWESCNFVRTFKTETYAQTHISNAALGGRTPSLIIKDYDEDYLSSLEIMIPKGDQADLNSYAANRIVFSAGKDASTTHRDMLFYTRLSRQSDVAPNFWMREDGSFWINSSDDTRGTAYNYPQDITIMNRALYVYPKKMGRITGSISDYPGWAGLEIGTLTHTQSIASPPSSMGLNGIKIGNISSDNTGSANSSSHHNLYFLNCGNLTTPASVYGVKLGALVSGNKENSVARGIDITEVSTTSNNSNAVGFQISTVSAQDFAYGIRILSTTSEETSAGAKFDAISGASTNIITSDTISSTIRTRAISISNILSDISATGIYMPNLLGTTRTTGLFIGIDNSTIFDSSLTGNHAIYTVGGKHVFGGDVDVTGDTIMTGTLNINGDTSIDGNLFIDEGRDINIMGTTDGNTMTISQGNLRITNGIIKEKVKTITTMPDQDHSGTDYLLTRTLNAAGLLEGGASNTRTVVIDPSSDGDGNIYRIGKGYDGQILTICLTESHANQVVFHRSTATNDSDIMFFGAPGADTQTMSYTEAWSFVCVLNYKDTNEPILLSTHKWVLIKAT
jgi:hypothetical protein